MGLISSTGSGLIGGALNEVGTLFTGTAREVTRAGHNIAKDAEKAAEQFDGRKCGEVSYRNATTDVENLLNTVAGIGGAVAGWKLSSCFGEGIQSAVAVQFYNAMGNMGSKVMSIGEDIYAANDYVREAKAKGVNVSRKKAILENLANLDTHTYDGARGNEIAKHMNDSAVEMG